MRELPILMNGAMVPPAQLDRKENAARNESRDHEFRRFRGYLADRKLEKWLSNAARRKARGVQHVNGGHASSGDKG